MVFLIFLFLCALFFGGTPDLTDRILDDEGCTNEEIEAKGD